MLSTSETISEAQQDRLKQKQPPGLSREEVWARIYRILFPHDSSDPSPCEPPYCCNLQVLPTNCNQDYQSNNEVLPDAALVPRSINQINSLIDHLCNTLPQRILTELQRQPQSAQNSASREVSLRETSELGGEIRQESSRRPLRCFTEPSRSFEFATPPSAYKLRKLVSDSVTETCTEWLRNRQEDSDSDSEESEDDNLPKDCTSHLSYGDDLVMPVVSTTTIPDLGDWNSETLRSQSSTSRADVSLLLSNPFGYPPNENWTRPADYSSYDANLLNPMVDNNFSTISPISFGFTDTSESTGLTTQSAQPYVHSTFVQSGDSQALPNYLFESSVEPLIPPEEIDGISWLPPGYISTIPPEMNQWPSQ